MHFIIHMRPSHPKTPTNPAHYDKTPCRFLSPFLRVLFPPYTQHTFLLNAVVFALSPDIRMHNTSGRDNCRLVLEDLHIDNHRGVLYYIPLPNHPDKIRTIPRTDLAHRMQDPTVYHTQYRLGLLPEWAHNYRYRFPCVRIVLRYP
jgi:hypothetical protein